MIIFDRNPHKHTQLAVSEVIDEFLRSEGFVYDDAVYHDNYGLTKSVEKYTSTGVTESIVHICIGLGRVSVYEVTPWESMLSEYEIDIDDTKTTSPLAFAEWLELVVQ